MKIEIERESIMNSNLKLLSLLMMTNVYIQCEESRPMEGPRRADTKTKAVTMTVTKLSRDY